MNSDTRRKTEISLMKKLRDRFGLTPDQVTDIVNGEFLNLWELTLIRDAITNQMTCQLERLESNGVNLSEGMQR